MDHDKFLEEYLSICAAVFDDLRRSGKLEETLESPERTRTAPSLQNKDIG